MAARHPAPIGSRFTTHLPPEYASHELTRASKPKRLYPTEQQPCVTATCEVGSSKSDFSTTKASYISKPDMARSLWLGDLMKSIRLVNIRSLVDSHDVRIAPITVLVGQNSSGKSTFARFFPLLRQSSEVLAREPLLWFGRFVDFGSAEEATSRIGSSSGPGFDVTFDVNKATFINRRRGCMEYGHHWEAKWFL